MAKPVIEFNIDASEYLRLAQALPEMTRALEEEMTRAMQESGMLLTTMTAARTPVNYGLLRAAIGWPQGFELQPGGLIDGLRGIIGASNVRGVEGQAASTYVEYVENGTRPHWAPIQPLKLWALRKFGDETVAYAVQRKIAQRGTKGAHMFRRAWNEGGQERVRKIWGLVLERALSRFRAEAGR